MYVRIETTRESMIQTTRSFCDKGLFIIESNIKKGKGTLSYILMSSLSDMSSMDKPPLGAILVNPLKLPWLCGDKNSASDEFEKVEADDTRACSSIDTTKPNDSSSDRKYQIAESYSKQNVVLAETSNFGGKMHMGKNYLHLPVTDEKLRYQQVQPTQDECKKTVLPKNLLDSITDLVRQKRVQLPCQETQICEAVELTEAEKCNNETLINVKEDFSNNCDDPADDQQSCIVVQVDTDHTAECPDTDNKVALKEFVSTENIGQQQLHNIPETMVQEDTSAESVGVSTRHESLSEMDLLFPDLLEELGNEDETVLGVYDISPLFTGKLDKRYKHEKRRAFKNHRQNSKWKKKAGQGTTNENDEEGEGEENVAKKQTPNYFIAMQIKNKQVHDALHKVQEEVLEGNQLLSSAMIKLTKLHLTLVVLRLETDDDIARSRCALETAMEKLQSTHLTKTLTVNLCGLGNFRNEIVFAKIKDNKQVDQLKAVVEVIEASFMAQGLILPDKHGFKPHITVMKLSKGKHLRKKGIKKIDEKLYKKYKSTEFGVEEVTGIQLCSMMKTDSTGYYQVEHQVPFVTGTGSVDDSGYDEDINMEPSDNTDLVKNPPNSSADIQFCSGSSDDSKALVPKDLEEKKDSTAERESGNNIIIDVDTLKEINDKVQNDETEHSDIADDLKKVQEANAAVENCETKDPIDDDFGLTNDTKAY